MTVIDWFKRKKIKVEEKEFEIIIPKTSIMVHANNKEQAIVKASDCIKYLMLTCWDDMSKKAANNETELVRVTHDEA